MQGLTYINNNEKRYILGKLEWNRVGVEEWVRNIAEAKFVVTRSFHGMLFSLMFHRQFAVVATRNGRSSRITDMLNLLGLSDRFFDSVDDLSSSKIWDNRVDYEKVDQILSELRGLAFDNLNKVLES